MSVSDFLESASSRDWLALSGGPGALVPPCWGQTSRVCGGEVTIVGAVTRVGVDDDVVVGCEDKRGNALASNTGPITGCSTTKGVWWVDAAP